MSNTELVIFATARALPGKEAELAAALKGVAAPTRAQPGCIDFRLYRSADGSAITAIEHWASKADHERHLTGQHVRELMARFNGVLAGPPDFAMMQPM